jgi:hypothetical protein
VQCASQLVGQQLAVRHRNFLAFIGGSIGKSRGICNNYCYLPPATCYLPELTATCDLHDVTAGQAAGSG